MEYLEFVDALLHQRKKKEKNFVSALFLILIDQPIKVSFQKLSTEAVYILFYACEHKPLSVAHLYRSSNEKPLCCIMLPSRGLLWNLEVQITATRVLCSYKSSFLVAYASAVGRVRATVGRGRTPLTWQASSYENFIFFMALSLFLFSLFKKTKEEH
jgi:hypothetical protein